MATPPGLPIARPFKQRTVRSQTAANDQSPSLKPRRRKLEIPGHYTWAELARVGWRRGVIVGSVISRLTPQ